MSHDERASLVVALGVPVSAELLELALTHRSFAYENGGVPHNERLEFLGDSVLGLAVTEKLFRENPDLPEGSLAKMRASVVSTVALAVVARGIELGRYLRLGRGEELTGGRDKSSILADTMEAIFGAVFLDSGPEVAKDLVLRLLTPLIGEIDRFGATMDPKTSLQEAAAALGGPAPHYVISSSGPDHARTFVARVSVGDLVSAEGTGSSKKHAEMAAALAAWNELDARTP
ncbi:ribonuclease III [Labedella phragmitis]|uniref:Ribonuclease 3 n=1 Tax=Labedella phragmitis TaxID=2498849 RepID=A0A444PVU1_9MICO|nr:ribonuclease III [Labedella phragmitis]RWZ51977.1 ribonuclease III [Labedella phragmitis]